MEATGSVVPPSTSPYITFPFVPFMSVNSSAAAPSSAMPSMSPSGSSVSTPLFCCVLSLLTLLGVTGNLYTLVLLVRRRRTKRRRGGGGTGSGGGGVTCCSLSLPVPSCLANKSSFSSSPVSSSPPHASSSSYLHMQVLSLALADLLYLLTAPFIVADSLGSGWAFGELGCRLLLSLDLLTMHASIFTLTAMSLDRYRAVADPLHATAASRRSGLLRIGLAWGLAVALSLPMMITLHLLVDRQGTLCVPAWDEQSSKVYLSVLFCTSILGPGLAIGALYATLGRLYWVSQTRPAWARGPGSSTAHPPRAPRPKVLLLILGIVLAFWACFLPFWVWQLLPLYRPDMLRTLPVSTQVTVNRVLTCLTYGNSCVNPFFYTLLTGNNRRRRSNNNNNRQQTPVSSANLLCRKSSPPQ